MPPSPRDSGRLNKVTNESEKEFIEDINCPLRSTESIRKISDARYLIVVVVVPDGKRKEKNVLRSLLPFSFSEPETTSCGFTRGKRRYFALIGHHQSSDQLFRL